MEIADGEDKERSRAAGYAIEETRHCAQGWTSYRSMAKTKVQIEIRKTMCYAHVRTERYVVFVSCVQEIWTTTERSRHHIEKKPKSKK
jgi:hypothetical protein